ncbi:tubulin-like doman-containing protein [Lujinxingia sediminis]|nr:tubulin-like doman-containing protein [Lujinxingia sediminis]
MANRQNLVVDELLTRPSNVCPTLFVGLGGCGCQIVMRVARHLKSRPDYAERYKDLTKFALIDTNINDLELHREDADESFLISDFEKEAYANLASGKLFLEADDYFTQWVPKDYRFRAGDTAGAGQIRIESRLGSYYQMKHGDLVPRFRRLLESLKRHEHGHRRLDTSEIRIVLCFSIAGGTGSGSFLPLAYMLRDQARALGKPNMLGVCVLPAVFEDKTGANKDGTFANSYAALKEVEHLMKLGSPESSFFPTDGIEFHYDPSDTSKRAVREKPFEFLYLIDKPESFSVDRPVDAAADGLYLQLFSPLFAVQAGDYDNYTQHQRFLVPHDFEAKGIPGFTSFYGSYGSAVLLVPTDGLAEYCSRAAALNIMRQSFLGAIPADPLYNSLRSHPEPFYEVTERDDEDARPVKMADFVKKEEGIRHLLRDRLFQKRVRLLARCEADAGEFGRFMAIFRHGHRLGEVPRENATWALDPERLTPDREQLADRGMNFSIGALTLEALCGPKAGAQPGLLAAARRAIEAASEELEAEVSVERNTLARDLVGRALYWSEDLKRRGQRVLDQGYTQHGIAFPGLEALLELNFLASDTEDVSLAAKRFAVLAMRDELRTEMRQPPAPTPFELDGIDDDEKIKEKDAPDLIRRLIDQAVERATHELLSHFIEQRTALRDKLAESLRILRVLEQGFDAFERDQTRQLERLREQGDHSTNQFVLDAEAFQIENGRRMWDFFYADRVATMPELAMSNPHIQQRLSGTVRDLSLRGSGSTTATLNQLFDALKSLAHTHLTRTLCGDPKIADPARRDGLTLAQALELEVVYRALYMSNLEAIQQRKDAAITEVVARYRAQPAERRIDLTEAIHQDYLRDKIRRVVNERADLLVSYDESRDQHGGVRPNHVFLAAIDESFRDTTVEHALDGANLGGMRWVKQGWHNPRQIVFYRAVLNVPLYVFGRMSEMKDHYYRFKNLSKRSKILHIDRSWENTLPDLDPDTAQEQHRQEQMRANIVNFAALWTLKDPLTRQGYIVLRDGTYLLRDPQNPTSLQSASSDTSTGFKPLGERLAPAINALPGTLDAERVKYLPYLQLLTAVREGMAPAVLQQIVTLPFQWRKNRDELRTQYGTSPSPLQQLKLSDFTDAFNRLREALDGLLEHLRNIETERITLGGDASANAAGLTPAQAGENLRQSVEILRGFQQGWQSMEQPERSTSVPPSFRSLFRPLGEDELHNTLESLRIGTSTAEPSPERTPGTRSSAALDEQE